MRAIQILAPAVALGIAMSLGACAKYENQSSDGGDGGTSDCPAMDAAGEGACEMDLGVVWNGWLCHSISGCSCVGEDCPDLFTDLGACLQDRGSDCFDCQPMDAEAARDCGPAEDPAVLYLFDGTGCVELTICECAGVDCDRLFFERSLCQVAYGECPT